MNRTKHLTRLFLRVLCGMMAPALFTMCVSSGKTYRVQGGTGEDIQILIDKANSRGGGIVTVPAGTYVVGSCSPARRSQK